MNVVFMGTPDFAVPSLTKLIESEHQVKGVFTQPDRPQGRKRELIPSPVKQKALQHQIPVFQPTTMRDPVIMEKIKNWAPDVIVTAAYGQLLPKEVLDFPPLGAINVHASLLPKFRGGAPVERAIMAGERETGVTIMYMVERLDAGDILSQESIPIRDDDDAGAILARLSQIGAQLLLSTLDQLARGNVKPQPQNEDEATYAPIIKREDEKIDWTSSALSIFNRIRALSPHRGAYTLLEGNTLKIWHSMISDDVHLSDPPGTIYQLSDMGIGVVCGDGTGLHLTMIQPAGRKRMKAADFLRGMGKQLKIGQILE